MTRTDATYAPSIWLGSRLASEALATEDPYARLSHACREGEERLRKLAGLVAGMVMEVDWLDREAETRCRELTNVVHGTHRHTDRPYTGASRAHSTALLLKEACTARDRAANFLRRLLICYRAAASIGTA